MPAAARRAEAWAVISREGLAAAWQNRQSLRSVAGLEHAGGFHSGAHRESGATGSGNMTSRYPLTVLGTLGRSHTTNAHPSLHESGKCWHPRHKHGPTLCLTKDTNLAEVCTEAGLQASERRCRRCRGRTPALSRDPSRRQPGAWRNIAHLQEMPTVSARADAVRQNKDHLIATAGVMSLNEASVLRCCNRAGVHNGNQAAGTIVSDVHTNYAWSDAQVVVRWREHTHHLRQSVMS